MKGNEPMDLQATGGGMDFEDYLTYEYMTIIDSHLVRYNEQDAFLLYQ